MSTGAKAGIAVGIVVLVLAVAAIVAVLFRRRTRRSNQTRNIIQEKDSMPGSASSHPPSYNQTPYSDVPSKAYNMPQTGPVELLNQHNGRVHEMS